MNNYYKHYRHVFFLYFSEKSFPIVLIKTPVPKEIPSEITSVLLTTPQATAIQYPKAEKA